MTVLSGLPGVGKDHWVAANRPDTPVVSLDALRTELGISPAGDQRAVAAAAYAAAREQLRAGRSFIWNATNISRQQRDLCIGLAADYRARIEIVASKRRPRWCATQPGPGPRPVPRRPWSTG